MSELTHNQGEAPQFTDHMAETKAVRLASTPADLVGRGIVPDGESGFRLEPSMEKPSVMEEGAELPIVEVGQLADDQKGFFGRRLEGLKAVWRRTKEVAAATTEVVARKPARLIGAMAINGTLSAVEMSRNFNGSVRRVNRSFIAGVQQAEADKKAGYDENNLSGRLKAKVQRRAFKPRQKPEVPKLTRDEQWLADHRRRVDERLGLN